jgi:hypothetical protein
MAGFELSRTTTIAAEPAAVRALIDDFRAWRRWSPWEDLDPDLVRTYGGPDSGTGARYAWRGNRKAGEGSMQITASEPTRVDIALEFLRPFKARNDVTFLLTPADRGTDVTWRMTGDRNPVIQVLGKLFFDKAIGRDLERGLAQLKTAAEASG